VTELVWARRAQPYLRLGGMHTHPRTSPPHVRTGRYQVDGDADTVPSRFARTASVPVGT
jgi:hypothetical protein